MLSTAGFRENTVLLNLTIKALERCLERFILADFDFRQQFPPSHGLIFEVSKMAMGFVHPTYFVDLPKNYSVAVSACQGVQNYQGQQQFLQMRLPAFL